MRFSRCAILSPLLLLGSTYAQYVSEGWKPGQPVTNNQAQAGHAYAPSDAASQGDAAHSEGAAKLGSIFDLSSYLEFGPIKALFSRAGVNITEKLEAARELAKIWDERIPLIDDTNYEDIVVEEQFESLEEEKDRIWFIAITVSSAQREGISRFVDEQFDKAFQLTQEAGDLQHIRWGRIDYMNVTRITTKWNVWRAPYLVVLKDRGQTLRFYRPGNIRLDPEILRKFLQQDAWEQTQPWHSSVGPGGRNEYMLDYLAQALTKVYNVTVMIPRWLLILISGSVGSLLVNILHNSRGLFSRSSNTKPEPTVPPSSSATTTTGESSSVQSPSKSGPNKRKTGRK